MKSQDWFVYIIRNEKGHLYTGITTDVERRFKEHSSSKKGAKFFGSGAPVEVVYRKKFRNRGEASSYEAMIKSLTRKKKLELLETAA